MTTYGFIAANKRRTLVLVFFFIAFIGLLGWLIDRAYGGGGFYLALASVYSLGGALVSYFAGDKIALAVSGAKPVTKDENPYVVRLVENLCITTGMPMPKVHIIDDPAINAFAAGRDPKHASIAVTSGAIGKLENEELEGVLAHELSHIKNFDIRVMTIVVVMVGVVSILTDLVFRLSWYGRGRRRSDEGGGNLLLLIGLALMILAPIIAQLIKLAVSRRREYLADASAVLVTRFPDGLSRALRKIAAESRPLRRASTATAHLFIANPFAGSKLANLFSTHPPLEDRVEALERMARGAA